jgi:hypothetical protein
MMLSLESLQNQQLRSIHPLQSMAKMLVCKTIKIQLKNPSNYNKKLNIKNHNLQIPKTNHSINKDRWQHPPINRMRENIETPLTKRCSDGF